MLGARRGEDDLVCLIVLAILVHKGYIKRVCCYTIALVYEDKTNVESWNTTFLGVRSPVWLPKVRRGLCLRENQNGAITIPNMLPSFWHLLPHLHRIAISKWEKPVNWKLANLCIECPPLKRALDQEYNNVMLRVIGIGSEIATRRERYLLRCKDF